MKIALIGYGKMGHIIESLAINRGHDVVCIIDKDNLHDFDSPDFATADVAIEFTTPQTAESNIMQAWKHGIPVVCGTTGWDIEEFRMTHFESKAIQPPSTPTNSEQTKTQQLPYGLMWSSNYSIGVNILFALNQQLAKFMDTYPEYIPHITEVHHIHKLDAPSGTAKTLQEAIGNEKLAVKNIESIRQGEVPGIHTITWDSPVDSISICHSAKSREGCALGAIIAAEWMQGKTGWHEFKEILGVS
jgi:4-hydroxy-tetrahydrodipicolinate reductase